MNTATQASPLIPATAAKEADAFEGAAIPTTTRVRRVVHQGKSDISVEGEKVGQVAHKLTKSADGSSGYDLLVKASKGVSDFHAIVSGVASTMMNRLQEGGEALQDFVGSALNIKLSRKGVATVAALAGTVGFLGLKPSEAHAGWLVKQGTTAPGVTPSGANYVTFGEQVSQNHVGWVEGRFVNSGNITVLSGIFTDSNNMLGVNPNTHSGSGPFEILRVGAGDYNNPSYVSNVSGITLAEAKYDAGVYHLATPTNFVVTPLIPEIAPTTNGTEAWLASYSHSKYGTTDPTMSFDGLLKGGQSRISGSFPGYDPAIFTSVTTGTTAQLTYNYPYVELEGGSGGYIGGTNSHFWGQTVAGTGLNGGTTTIFRNNTPEFVNWYTSAIVPEPGSIALGGMFVLLLSRRPDKR